MTRTIRHVTLLRWTVVAVHTALIVSAGVLLANTGDSRHERTTRMATTALMMLPDLPVVVLTIPVTQLMSSPSSPVTRAILFSTIFTLLGGLQWYLLASLLARWTCGFQKTMTIASRRFGIVLFVGLILVGCCAVLPWSGGSHRADRRNQGPYPAPPIAFTGDSKGLENSAVVPTLDTPMPKGKNVIWCASFQMAWARLKDDVIGEPVRVANAEEVAKRLNSAIMPEGDLPKDSYYAAAGFTQDGIAETIRREMQERFEKEPSGLNDKDAVILAYAYLRANVPFTLPYFDNDREFLFTDSRGHQMRVSSFGIREKDESKYLALRDQPEVLYLRREKEEGWGQPTEFALDLCHDSKPNQIILACIPRKETVSAMLTDLERKISENRPDERERQLGLNSTLLVPNLYWNIAHHFAELEGADKQVLNAKGGGVWINTAIQAIDFRLDRSGVELEAESHLVAKCSDPNFHFDRPFLVVVKKRGAASPFFVMWVDNAELLCKPQ